MLAFSAMESSPRHSAPSTSGASLGEPTETLPTRAVPIYPRLTSPARAVQVEHEALVDEPVEMTM